MALIAITNLIQLPPVISQLTRYRINNRLTAVGFSVFVRVFIFSLLSASANLHFIHNLVKSYLILFSIMFHFFPIGLVTSNLRDVNRTSLKFWFYFLLPNHFTLIHLMHHWMLICNPQVLFFKKQCIWFKFDVIF